LQRVSGRITVVQEQRFRLVTDGGQGFLLTLAHDAGLNGSDLCLLCDAGLRVDVELDGEPGLASAVAHSVKGWAATR